MLYLGTVLEEINQSKASEVTLSSAVESKGEVDSFFKTATDFGGTILPISQRNMIGDIQDILKILMDVFGKPERLNKPIKKYR
ncbi:hypothetical protein [Mesobacillus foraminis]|uniref:Uncharacterized protein n=1 Tax=Mesobacillus foraminis TaxID=279826 RepID=A0A4R2B0A0_9BACI|nr:hypothetical protein [Mesobacillus foraminis]TCN19741.1 hypothetical protein EV146_11645 [Mesobacillus foraminis]